MSTTKINPAVTVFFYLKVLLKARGYMDASQSEDER